MNTRRHLPWILGITFVVALSGAALIVIRPTYGNGNTVVSSTQGATLETGVKGGTTTTTTRTPPPPPPALAQTSSARTPSVPPAKKIDKKGDSDPIKDKVGKIAARYETGPQYQIRVGASPASVRASHPINLYIPKPDPKYNIVGNIVDPPTSTESQFISWMRTHTQQKNVTFLREKWQLARGAIERGYLTHKRVLAAFLLTPREWFVRNYNLKNSYENTSLPIGYGQTITDPGTVIAMTNALDPKPNQRVLEIGTGSGYQSAFLSELSNYVYTIEIVRPLGEETNQIYLLHTPAMPQYANIHRRLADGYYGWSKYAPFDRIIVTTGIDHIPPDLLKELKPGGIMIIPVGPPTGQTILMVKKTIGPNGQVELKRRDIYRGYAKTVFVPFTAAGGGTHNTGGRSSGR